MSNEYIQMIEDLKKEYRTAWNIAYKLDKTYWDADVTEAWADKEERMEEQENKRKNQIFRFKMTLTFKKVQVQKKNYWCCESARAEVGHGSVEPCIP